MDTSEVPLMPCAEASVVSPENNEFASCHVADAAVAHEGGSCLSTEVPPVKEAQLAASADDVVPAVSEVEASRESADAAAASSSSSSFSSSSPAAAAESFSAMAPSGDGAAAAPSPSKATPSEPATDEEARARALAERDARADSVTSFIVSEDPPRPRLGHDEPPQNLVEDGPDDVVAAPPDSELCDDLCAPWLLNDGDGAHGLPPPENGGLIEMQIEQPVPRREDACCLIGRILTDTLVIEGRWGMTRGAHADEAHTSKFEYRFKGPSRFLAPDAEPMTAAVTLSGAYTGFFHLQQAGRAQPVKVDEKSMTLEFAPNTEGNLNVRGGGKNRYGGFTIEGTCDTNGTNFEVYRVYQPKPASRRPGGTQPKVQVPPQARRPSGKDLNRVKVALEVAQSAPMPQSRTNKRKAPAPAALRQQYSSAATGDSRPGSGRIRKAPSHLRDLGAMRVTAENQHLSVQMRRCHAIVCTLQRIEGSHWFHEPVDAIRLGVPHYHAIIPHPMDLGTLRSNLERGVYAEVPSFAADARRIFRNAMTFNVIPDAAPHIAARNMLERLEAELRALDSGAARSQKKSSQPKRELVDDYEFDTSAVVGPSAKKRNKGSGKGKGKGGQGDRVVSKLGGDLVPVTQLVDMQRQMEQMQATITALQRQAQQNEIQMQTNLEMGVVGGAPNPAMAKAQASRPLSYEEKAQLSDDINALPADKLTHVLKIVQDHMPLLSSKAGSPDDEIEVDIESLDAETLRHLQVYVKSSLKGAKPNKAPATSKRKAAPGAAPLPAAVPALLDDDDEDDDLAYDVLGA